MSGLFSSPDPPDAPDYQRLIREQALMNRINQTTPYGTLTFGTTAANQGGGQAAAPASPSQATMTTQPYTPMFPEGTPGPGPNFGRPTPEQLAGGATTGGVAPTGGGGGGGGGGLARQTATFNLSPERQRQLDLSQALVEQRMGQLPGTAFDPDIPAVGGQAAGSLGPFDQSTQAQQASFQSALSLLNPEFERQGERLSQTLANQGLPMGGEAYSDEMNRFERERGRALTEAAFQAVQQGNQRQNQLFSQGLSALGAQQGVRRQNISELQALMNAQNAQPGLNQFFSPGSADVTGAAGLQQQGELAGYQGDLQQQSSAMGGMAQLGSAAIMAMAMCSRDYKTNKRPVEQILPRLDALTIEAWDYKDGYGDGGTHIGPYAEDFKRLFGVGDGRMIPLIDAIGVLFLAVKELKARTEVAHG